MTVFFPTYLVVASPRDAGKEGVSRPHTAEPNGSLYGVIEIQHLRCCWKFSLLLNKSDDLKT